MTEHKFNALLARIRAGDMSALEPIYTEYHRKMTADASYILGGNDGEDAASAAFLKLIDYAKSNETKHINVPDAFMRTLVKHTALDMLRARKPVVELENAEEVPSPCDMETSSVERNDIMHALQCLQEPQRDIAIMYYIYAVKIKDIAAELNMPVGTVKWHLNKIRSDLKKYF